MKRTLLLDGAMGTELQNRGIDIPLPLWSADANIKHPEVVINIHKDYINSGADIVTTGLPVINEMIHHPKTNESYDGFMKDFAAWIK